MERETVRARTNLRPHEEIHMADTILIDLVEFNKTGIIEMGRPSQRNKTMMQNALGNCSRTHMERGVPVVDETRIGDAEIIQTLVYVRKAPFNNTLKDFLAYCDTMEPGVDTDLFDKMLETRRIIETGQTSPFADSQGAETESSD